METNSMPYKLLKIQHSPYLSGDISTVLNQVELLGLKPGDKIVSIGRKTPNGKISSSCRVTHFTPYGEYVGVVTLTPNDVYAAFRVSMYNVADNTKCREPYYLLLCYIEPEGTIKEGEFIQQDIDNHTIAIYKAVYRMYKPKTNRSKLEL